MHINTYILRTRVYDTVEMYAIKAHSREEAVLKYWRLMKDWNITPAEDIQVYFVCDEVALFHSYSAV